MVDSTLVIKKRKGTVVELEDFMFTDIFTDAFQEVKEKKQSPLPVLSKLEITKIVAHCLCLAMFGSGIIWMGMFWL